VIGKCWSRGLGRRRCRLDWHSGRGSCCRGRCAGYGDYAAGRDVQADRDCVAAEALCRAVGFDTPTRSNPMAHWAQRKWIMLASVRQPKGSNLACPSRSRSRTAVLASRARQPAVSSRSHFPSAFNVVAPSCRRCVTSSTSSGCAAPVPPHSVGWRLPRRGCADRGSSCRQCRRRPHGLLHNFDALVVAGAVDQVEKLSGPGKQL
jgi:hypothetical protein